MRNEKQQRVITDIIRNECRSQSRTMRKLLLFGSRTTGYDRPDSDWDFLLVVAGSLTRKQRLQLWLPIDTALARIGVAADIIIKGEAEYNRDKRDIGKMTYYAEKTGIAV